MQCLHCSAEIQPHFKACPACGERVSELLQQNPEGLIEGKYKILSRLGAGGMGEVYKAIHVSLHRACVLKLMHPTLVNDKEAQERFMREARLASRVNHPNVATLHDFSVLPNGSFFMVSEFVDGSTLDKIIRKQGALNPRHAASIAVRALAGLDAIHRAGLIHRDISPDNIMIGQNDAGDEIVKIIDLGIAKGGDLADQQTRTGMFVGKWRYCSPEHLGILPEGQKIDARADIYSFGIVLYEMLTGAVPFTAEAPEQYFHQHQRVTPKPFRVVQPSLPAIPELEAIVFRALEKDRNKRFGSARDMAAAIEALLPKLPDRVDDATATMVLPSSVAAAAKTERTAPPTLGATVPATRAPRQGISPAVLIGVGLAALLVVGSIAAIFVMQREKPAPARATVETAPTESAVTIPPPPVTSPETVALTTETSQTAQPETVGTSTIVEGKREEPQKPESKKAAPVAPLRAEKKGETTATAAPVEEPKPVATETAEPDGRGSRLRDRLRIGGRRGAFDASDEAKSADFKPGIIDDYSDLRSNRYVTWAWKASGVELAESPVRVTSFRGTHAETFRAAVQSALNDVTEEAEGPELTAEGAVFWSDAANGLRGIELLIRDGSKRVIAKIRHRVRDRAPQDAAEAAADSLADYYEEN